MKPNSTSRRITLALALIAAASLLPAVTRAQEYPSQDIRFICGFPPGSGADIFVRYFAEKLRPIAGRTVVVENKVGAASNIATEYVARAKPDGYTLYPFTATTVASSMYLFKNPPVDVGKALRVAATLSTLSFTLVVDAASPHKSVAELTAAMKQKGSRASYGVAANPARIMGAIYKDKAGLEAIEVQYRTAADTLNEMANGKLDYALHDPVFALAQQRAGRWRVLAVSASQRLQAAPDIPTMTESGVPMSLDLWWGVMMPIATPKPIVDTVNRWFSQIVGTPETRKFLADSGADPMINTPERSQEMFQAAIKEWEALVRMAKIEPQ